MLFQTLRWDDTPAPEMAYRFLVPEGIYQVNLLMKESATSSSGLRVFDVQMEGILAMDDVDIIAEAGSDTALIKTVQVAVLDGELNIEFLHQVGDPKVYAIEAIRIGDAVPDTTPPEQPTGLKGSALGASDIDLDWNPSSDVGGSGVAGYRVYRDSVEIATTSVTGYSDSGLLASTLYNYTVEAFDATGNVSPKSDLVSVTTLLHDIVNTAPEISGSPAGSVVANSSYSFQPNATDADGDELIFSISNQPGWADFDATTGLLSGTPADTDAGRTYDNIVISVSDDIDTVSLPPFSIRVDAAVPQTGSFTLNWTAPATRADGTPLSLADIAGFRLYYGDSAGSYPHSVNIADGTAQSATVTDVPVGTHSVVMTTYDVEGRESGYSAEISKTAQ